MNGLLMTKEEREIAKHTLMQEQADYLVGELGKLKGSVVKVGQMLALYGEHFLPKAVLNALHTPGCSNDAAVLACHLCDT